MNNEFISESIKENYGISNKIVKNLDSSVGNVYDVFSDNSRYIVKIYSDLNHVNRMIQISEILNNGGIIIPKIIENLNGLKYIGINNYFIVVYEFLKGKNVSGIINEELIYKIAKEVRKMHDLVDNNDIGLDVVDFNINSDRKSLLHFDLTKDNILSDDGIIKFIDFDDVKYGDSVIDISILIALFFFSKKRGVDLKGVKCFIDSYYGDDIDLKNKEIGFIKKCALKWINDTLKNNEFEISTTESFEVKKKLIKEYL